METVGDIQREKKGNPVFTIRPDQTVIEAVQEMCKRHVGALLVYQGESLLGIFSERDLMVRVILAGRDPKATLLSEVMTPDVVCVTAGTRLAEAMAIITERRCRHLPVVDAGRVTGVISIGDMVRNICRDQEYEIKFLTDYVTGRYPG